MSPAQVLPMSIVYTLARPQGFPAFVAHFGGVGLARGAYTEYVSAPKARPARAKPLRRRLGTQLAAFSNIPRKGSEDLTTPSASVVDQSNLGQSLRNTKGSLLVVATLLCLLKNEAYYVSVKWPLAKQKKFKGLNTQSNNYFFTPRIESFAALATLNLTTFLAGILIGSPVWGFRPIRALR